jgi:hypothetical protein
LRRGSTGIPLLPDRARARSTTVIEIKENIVSTPKLAKANAPDSAPETTTTTTFLPVRETSPTAPSPTWSQRKASLIGGVALFLLAVVAGLANFGAVEAFVTPGDAAKTAQDLMASESLFRLGIAGLMAVVILDIVVAYALMVVFQPVNRSVATLAAVFRIAYATVFLVAISQLVSALALVDVPNEALRAIGQFHVIWDAGYTLFGMHLLLVGFLVYR